MAQDTINKMFEAAKMRLKTEHDSMIENIKEDLLNYNRKTLIKTEHL
ncbi:MAG TPA: hypothetical protein VKA91_03445 [Nitrososphaeraceae archaeon]|jgi:hypothetical protein|nr:hypothetical protein [Nitrososphaeraceae archaeon]